MHYSKIFTYILLIYLYLFYFLFQFDINKLKINSGKLMNEKLLEFNKLEIANLMRNEKNHKFLTERIKRLVLKAFPERYI